MASLVYDTRVGDSEVYKKVAAIVNAIANRVLGSAVFVFCLCTLQLFLDGLELDRLKVLSGEVWRLWTAHLVHTNIFHLALNILASLAIYFVFFTKVKFGELLAYGFIFAAPISAALLYIYPELGWYNGLSGLLHAFVAFFSIRLVRNGNKIYMVGLAALWLKVLIETLRANLGYENLIGDMTVLTEAHLIGASIGTITAFIGLVLWYFSGQSEH